LTYIATLKETIWKEIKTETSDDEPHQFTALLKALPENVAKDALPNISVPFCFICLLHLANEKGLSIEQEKGNLQELSIRIK